MSLRTRLIGGTFLMIVLLGVGVIALLRGSLGARLEGELQRRGVAVAKYVAADSVSPLVTDDRLALQLIVRNAQHVEDDIAYIFVQDGHGAVLAHTFGETFPTRLRTANAAAGASGPVVKLLRTGDGEVFDVALPLVRGELGTIRVGLYAREIRAGVARVIQAGIGITVGCLVLFGGFALAVDLAITRNLTRLAEGARALGLGDLEHRVAEGGAAEFGEMARAFNAMADNIERSEAKLVDLNSALLAQVGERTRAEEELRRASEELARQNEELKKLDRLRDGFIRDVSHELKTPVAKHAMQLEILRERLARCGCGPEVDRVLGVMESSIRRQQQVIRNLLGLARLEAGARGYRREPVRLDEVIASVVEDYRPVLEARRVELTTSCAPVAVTSDGEMLWHVFSNLLNNAIKFQAQPVGGRIAISLAAEEGSAVVRVRDWGIGLEPEERARVFDKFYQGTASTEGSGVGLTICRMIVEGVGGRIWFESEGRGKGATAVVSLPLGAGGEGQA